MKRPHPTIALLLWLTAAYSAGFIGWLGTKRGLEGLYPVLRKPAFTPPDWAFGPVWTVMYAFMGFAAWRVWREESPRGGALALWWLQLGLNALWPWLFFGFGRLLPAFIEIVLLALAILATLVAFARRDRKAGGLMAPYLVWVVFATVLNGVIWRMNP